METNMKKSHPIFDFHLCDYPVESRRGSEMSVRSSSEQQIDQKEQSFNNCNRQSTSTNYDNLNLNSNSSFNYDKIQCSNNQNKPLTSAASCDLSSLIIIPLDTSVGYHIGNNRECLLNIKIEKSNKRNSATSINNKNELPIRYANKEIIPKQVCNSFRRDFNSNMNRPTIGQSNNSLNVNYINRTKHFDKSLKPDYNNNNNNKSNNRLGVPLTISQSHPIVSINSERKESKSHKTKLHLDEFDVWSLLYNYFFEVKKSEGIPCEYEIIDLNIITQKFDYLPSPPLLSCLDRIHTPLSSQSASSSVHNLPKEIMDKCDLHVNSNRCYFTLVQSYVGQVFKNLDTDYKKKVK
jgi:hypothetical protein